MKLYPHIVNTVLFVLLTFYSKQINTELVWTANLDNFGCYPTTKINDNYMKSDDIFSEYCEICPQQEQQVLFNSTSCNSTCPEGYELRNIFYFLTSYARTGNVAHPTSVDIDSDGDLDLFVGQEESGIITFWENMQGENIQDEPVFFITQSNIHKDGDLVSSGSSLNPLRYTKLNDYSFTGLLSPAFIDIDDDDDYDVVIGDDSGVFVYFLNNGTRYNPDYEYISESLFSSFDVSGESSPVFVDIDNDGDLDMFSGNQVGFVFQYENINNEQFIERTGSENALNDVSTGQRTMLTFGDIDNDGDYDVIIGSTGGDLDYWKNIGNMTHPVFEEQLNTFSIDVGGFSAPLFIDIDNDLDLDLIVGDDDGNLLLYENQGNLTHFNYVSQSETTMKLSNPLDNNYVTNEQYSTPVFVDIDDDGDYDVFAGNNQGTLTYYENIGTKDLPDFDDTVTNPLSSVNEGIGSVVAFCDVDNDNDQDAFIGSYTGTIKYYENTGSASSPSFTANTVDNPFSSLSVGDGWALSFGDLDNDNDFDAVSGDRDGIIHYFENQGSASSPNFVEITTSSLNPFSFIETKIDDRTLPQLFDWDNDTDYDLIVGNIEGTIYYYENNGTISSPSYKLLQYDRSPFWPLDVGDGSSPAAIDINNDGLNDFFTGSASTDILYFQQAYEGICTACGSGFYQNQTIDVTDEDSVSCIACSKGKYSNSKLASSCSYCDPGTYGDERGLAECTDCPYGTSNIETGSTSISDCLSCGLGYYASEGSVNCTICEAGTYNDNIEADECKSCPAGTYGLDDGSESLDDCTKCSKGKYSETIGASDMNTCQSCDVGKYNSQVGSSNETACLSCNVGYYSNIMGATDISNCTACEAGKYNNVSASSDCNLCERGTYNELTAQTSCMTCSQGTYNAERGSDSIDFCLSCPTGTWSNTEGAKSDDVCINCIAGKWSNTLGATSDSYCSDCPIGRYSDTSGGNSLLNCTNCNLGMTTLFEGSDSSTECINCDAGKYGYENTTNSEYICLDCLAGTTSNEGSINCTNCEIGKFNFQDGTDTCYLCPRGTYNPEEGGYHNASCLGCPVGTYNPDKGQDNITDCQACPTGTFSSSNGSVTCDQCKSGKFSDNPGQDHCSSCPLFLSSGKGSSNCDEYSLDGIHPYIQLAGAVFLCCCCCCFIQAARGSKPGDDSDSEEEYERRKRAREMEEESGYELGSAYGFTRKKNYDDPYSTGNNYNQHSRNNNRLNYMENPLRNR